MSVSQDVFDVTLLGEQYVVLSRNDFHTKKKFEGAQILNSKIRLKSTEQGVNCLGGGASNDDIVHINQHIHCESGSSLYEQGGVKTKFKQAGA
jgi:hypothetical protein